MKNFLGKMRDYLVSKPGENSTKKKVSTLLDGFDVNTVSDITESDLQQILRYKFLEPKQTFFIIGGKKEQETDHKFTYAHIENCYKSDWYALIRPNDSSYIIIPSKKIWLQFNGRGQSFRTSSDGRMWEKGGGAFQFDKNTGRLVSYSQLESKSVLKLFTEIYATE